MKFHKIFLLFMSALLCLMPIKSYFCYAVTDSSNELLIYEIFDDYNNKLFESSYVEIGDFIITKDYKQYEIYEIDEENLIAYAEYNGSYIKPKIMKKEDDNVNLSSNIKKSVGLYMTHNDESYVPTDNTSSIYGAGGIHDVARCIADNFNALNYSVYLDETLHIPHDNNAYSRSYITANNLISNYNVDALFDIHRDGVSRNVYVKTIDGVERCKVRIVVGLANENNENNMQFALYLLSIAEEYYPWLFLDIYCAKGHYNQALTSKGLLFEMGTYLAEKEIVLKTVPYLVEVIDKTLFSTVVEEDNSLLITNDISTEQEQNLVNNVLEQNNSNQEFNNKYSSNVVIFTCIFCAILLGIIFYSYKKHKFLIKKEKFKNLEIRK